MARYTIPVLNVPSTVTAGEPFEIDAKVCAEGDPGEATYTIDISGTNVLTDSFHLVNDCVYSAPDASTSINEPGDYVVSVVCNWSGPGIVQEMRNITVLPADGGDGGNGGDGGDEGAGLNIGLLALGAGAVWWYSRR